MKSIKVNYDREKDLIQAQGDTAEEDWVAVCEKFNNDVHKIKSVNDFGEYNSLYECYDDNNNRVFYVVHEDAALFKLRRKNLYKKLGL